LLRLLAYNVNEMSQLQEKAISFIMRHRRWIPCELFYRDKDETYYDYCRYQCKGLLLPIMKNENGDPASPINGCINGIFLAASIDWKTGHLPAISPYGHVRFHVPVEKLYGPNFNLYFADFYCHNGSKSHHLTLVITRDNSAADTFCKVRLLKLNRMENPFLYQDWETGRMMHTTSAWIHIFYTEVIPIDAGWFDRVQCKITSMKTGKPKNASCPDCNIYLKQ